VFDKNKTRLEEFDIVSYFICVKYETIRGNM